MRERHPRRPASVRRFAAVLAAWALVAGAAACTSQPAAPAHHRLPPLVVATADGEVRGITTGPVDEYLGIPYAAPPVGPLRWQPPQPAARWRGIRAATEFAPHCAQPAGVFGRASMSENCLYLNVFLPAAHRAGLPVMVWIHGGGFVGGESDDYDPSGLVAHGVIVVTINYRLGALGFLAHPALADHPGGPSGDYGLMDQQAALRWVQRNARAFGGDPGNVTIFGESAGGASVCDNMASPTASGLFSRAIAESGCFLLSSTRQAAEQQGATFAAKLGCTDPATAAGCLRGKSAAALLAEAGGPLGGWGPVAGTPVLPLQPASAFAAGRYAHVPLLQGTNHDEGRFFVGFEFDALGKPLTAAQYPQVLTAQFGASAAARIQAVYPLSGYASPDLAYAAVFTDSAFSCPALDADLL